MITTIATLITALATAILGVINLVLYLKDRNAEKISLWLFYRQGLFDWYRRCNGILCSLKGLDLSFAERKPLLCELSACIDEGRFYFPNLDNGADHGAGKPSAYQGYRDEALDPLVAVYKICASEKNYEEGGKKLYQDSCETIEDARRDFTSHVESRMETRKFLKRIGDFVQENLNAQKAGKEV